MSSSKVNPFYIAPNNQEDEEEDDEWDWQDDNDDLDELLGDGTDGQQRRAVSVYPGGRPNRQSREGNWKRYFLALLIILVLTVIISATKGDGLEHNGNDIKTIAILGERNSGVHWMETSLAKCFNTKIETKLQRESFMFQDPKQFQDNLWVVVMVRNVYDWILLMESNPLNAPNHKDLSDEDFILKSWTENRPEDDGDESTECQQGYAYDEVLPCKEQADNNAIYELQRDHSGDAFSSVLDLRAAKIQNFVVDLKNKVEGIIVVKYEDLDEDDNGDPGIKKVVDQISEWVREDPTCDLTKNKDEFLPEQEADNGAIRTEFVDLVNAHTDWKTEEMVQYEKQGTGGSSGLTAVPSKAPTGEESHPTHVDTGSDDDDYAGDDDVELTSEPPSRAPAETTESEAPSKAGAAEPAVPSMAPSGTSTQTPTKHNNKKKKNKGGKKEPATDAPESSAPSSAPTDAPESDVPSMAPSGTSTETPAKDKNNKKKKNGGKKEPATDAPESSAPSSAPTDAPESDVPSVAPSGTSTETPAKDNNNKKKKGGKKEPATDAPESSAPSSAPTDAPESDVPSMTPSGTSTETPAKDNNKKKKGGKKEPATDAPESSAPSSAPTDAPESDVPSMTPSGTSTETPAKDNNNNKKKGGKKEPATDAPESSAPSVAPTDAPESDPPTVAPVSQAPVELVPSQAPASSP